MILKEIFTGPRRDFLYAKVKPNLKRSLYGACSILILTDTLLPSLLLTATIRPLLIHTEPLLQPLLLAEPALTPRRPCSFAPLTFNESLCQRTRTCTRSALPCGHSNLSTLAKQTLQPCPCPCPCPCLTRPIQIQLPLKPLPQTSSSTRPSSDQSLAPALNQDQHLTITKHRRHSPGVLSQLIHCPPARQFFRRTSTFLLPCCSSTAYQLFFRCLSNALVPVQPALMLPGLMLLCCFCAVLLPVCLASLLFSRPAYLQLLTSAAHPQNSLLPTLTARLPLCRKRHDVCSRFTES